MSDTVGNLGVDTTYHCRLVATNSAGTTQSADNSFSTAKNPPTIVSETSVAVTGPKVVVLTATANANYRSTECYFEYGQTTSYGMRTAAKSIGAGGSGVVVRDTIKGISWDTTYHCRLVAENPAGRTVGSDQSFVCPSAGWVDFVFPLEAGTTWHYTYHMVDFAITWHYETYGRQVWRSAGFTSPNVITILVTRIDTNITYPRAVGQDTTTVITQSDTSFSIIVTTDSLYIQWYQLAMHGYENDVQDLFKIPRIVESNTDTITRLWKFSYGSSYKRAIYVSGKGLTSWKDYNSSNYFWDEGLTLESVSP